eukprot:TRINITY_DN534_c2_g1_i5.p1 TRINITY_DN534_c2_g1~~TRINITY_DN534_c2_g1_i5.p1  ORF type:complete len:201 (-),score=37.65 TRINITY_DN534_c2_g1_i5:101-703(-)
MNPSSVCGATWKTFRSSALQNLMDEHEWKGYEISLSSDLCHVEKDLVWRFRSGLNLSNSSRSICVQAEVEDRMTMQAFFYCKDRADSNGLLPTQFWFPVLFVKGPPRIVDPFLDWVRQRFDAIVSELQFPPFLLLRSQSLVCGGDLAEQQGGCLQLTFATGLDSLKNIEITLHWNQVLLIWNRGSGSKSSMFTLPRHTKK